MLLRRLMICCSVATLCAAQDPSELLQRVRSKVMESVNRLPKYMCTQTTNRVRTEPTARFAAPPCNTLIPLNASGAVNMHHTRSDRLRFDVGIAGGKEIYSWAGENQFQDRDLLDMIPGGTISTGSFASFLTMIFETDGSKLIERPRAMLTMDRPWRAQSSFFFLGPKSYKGRTVDEFVIRIPADESHYRFRNAAKQFVTTAYDVTLDVDAATFDLVHLLVETNELPEEAAACLATTNLDYRPFRINDAEFLLPSEVRLQILNANGRFDDNRTIYSGCHEFLGESKVMFDAPADIANEPAGKPLWTAITALPAGLNVILSIDQDINTATAAAGDAIECKLVGPIRDGGHILAPVAAQVHGRIVRLLRNYVADEWQLTIKLETVRFGSTVLPMAAVPEPVAFQGAQKDRVLRRGRRIRCVTAAASQQH